ncbi:MAG: class I SAM-dependent methyltransferase [Nitrososphaerota archaeon]|nr:class I SAM-dependent methyltransferase [Nitrososphaerota archaeon]
MEAEYDQMADEYDATRDAATPEEVDAIRRSLEGSASVLDVGVGTGRFAGPLSSVGFEVTGADVSRRMLVKAREKGLTRLVLGDAYRLPFRDKAFDGAMIIHVLHVVADWRTVMREIGRVTKGNAVTIMRVPQNQRAEEAAAKKVTEGPHMTEGRYPVRTQHRMWQNEQELKAEVPPVQLERIRDEVVTLSLTEAFRRMEAKRPFASQIVPPAMREAMMERIFEVSGGQQVQRRIVEDLAVWRADDLQTIR